MHEHIPHSKPSLGPAEAQAAADAVLSGQVAAAQRTARFEQALAQYVGAQGAVATSSGTAALYAALKALNIGPGRQVLVPSFVCTALLHAVWAAGAEPIVCDIGDDFNLSPHSAREKQTAQTAAVILPHMFGTPANVQPLLDLGLPIIEDCAQALGARLGGHLDGQPCGSLGTAAICSFYATKMITTGEGGMLAARSQQLLDRARDLIEYDKKPDAARRFNLKFNDVAAAIGLVQLDRLDEFIARRQHLAELYHAELAHLPGVQLPRDHGSVYYRYVIQVDDPEHLIAKLAAHGICAARPVDPPLHRVAGQGGCPNADRAWDRAVSLPIYPSLTDAQARRVAAAIRES